MPSRLANHTIAADNGRSGLLRELCASLLEIRLERPERAQLWNRAGPILRLRDADMDERTITEPEGEIPDVVSRFRTQFLKHRLDQALVLIGCLRLRLVAHHGQFHSMLHWLQFR